MTCRSCTRRAMQDRLLWCARFDSLRAIVGFHAVLLDLPHQPSGVCPRLSVMRLACRVQMRCVHEPRSRRPEKRGSGARRPRARYTVPAECVRGPGRRDWATHPAGRGWHRGRGHRSRRVGLLGSAERCRRRQPHRAGSEGRGSRQLRPCADRVHRHGARGARLECIWWNSQRHRQRRCFVRRRLLRHPGDQPGWTWLHARCVGTRIRKRCQCAVHGIRSHRRRGAGAVKMRAALLPSLLISLVEAHDAAPARRETFRDPAVVVSHDGVLELTLTAARGATQVGGRRVVAQVYNGSYLPPTLRVQPGDVVRLRLVNALDETTNLHLHGLAVSPLGASDNVFLHIAPGRTQDYEIRIPATHPPGLYWYHPHPHGRSDEQVRNGMSGALVVEGLLDPFPELRDVREHVLLLKDAQIGGGEVVHREIGDDAIRTVNGMLDPTITLRPGETELWRIGNVGADLYYLLTLDGHRFYEVARDGHRLARLVPKRELLLEPGAREEVLVQAAGPGTYALRTAGFDTGPPGNHYPGAVLATVPVEGAAGPPLALPQRVVPLADLRRQITDRRTIVFSESAAGDTFFVDGRTFDPDRTDTQ